MIEGADEDRGGCGIYILPKYNAKVQEFEICKKWECIDEIKKSFVCKFENHQIFNALIELLFQYSAEVPLHVTHMSKIFDAFCKKYPEIIIEDTEK